MPVMTVFIPEALRHVEVTENVWKSISARVCVRTEEMAAGLRNVHLVPIIANALMNGCRP